MSDVEEASRSRSKSKEDDKKVSRSRSKSRGKRRKKKSRSKERSRRSRDRKRRKSPSRSKSRERSGSRSRRSGSRSRRRRRSKSPYDPDAEEKQRQARAEREAHKDEYTVFVHQIHPKVDERDLFDFFSHVGKVEDIRLIRDQRTHKSKGLAYVEFWEKDSVIKAVALSGQLIGGYPITVQPTAAEKTASTTSGAGETDGASMRLFVGSLHPNMGEDDLKPVFEAFGALDYIEITKDDDGNSRGFGFVQYKNGNDAKQALDQLDGLELAGRVIRVGVVESDQPSVPMGNVGDLDEGGGLQLTAQGRAQLMQKLTRGEMPGQSAKAAMYNPNPVIAQASSLSVPMIQPTVCLVIKNMFDPKTETEPDFDEDIRLDVEEECAKYGGLKHCFCDKNSQGHVYLKFSEVGPAMKAQRDFHGRWFASRQITAEFVVESMYQLKFPNAGR